MVQNEVKPNGRLVCEPDLNTMLRQRVRAVDVRDPPRWVKSWRVKSQDVGAEQDALV